MTVAVPEPAGPPVVVVPMNAVQPMVTVAVVDAVKVRTSAVGHVKPMVVVPWHVRAARDTAQVSGLAQLAVTGLIVCGGVRVVVVGPTVITVVKGVVTVAVPEPTPARRRVRQGSSVLVGH